MSNIRELQFDYEIQRHRLHRQALEAFDAYLESMIKDLDNEVDLYRQLQQLGHFDLANELTKRGAL
jgi:hypothetical protein